MKETVLDVLMYLFESYVDSHDEPEPNRHELKQELGRAGFHDRDGKPLLRPFSVFPIGAKIERPSRFVGPPGSTTGYIFVGKIRC